MYDSQYVLRLTAQSTPTEQVREGLMGKNASLGDSDTLTCL